MGVNVLVIEDDEPIALALVNGLRRAGFDAESVGSASAALNALPTEFILLDLSLPDRDGVDDDGLLGGRAARVARRAAFRRALSLIHI